METAAVNHEKNGEGYSGRRHHLRKHRYLRVEQAVVKAVHLRLVFMGFATLSIGVVVGFNIKDFMLRTCTIRHISDLKQSVRKELLEKKFKDVQLSKEKQEIPAPKPAKPPREPFKHLPEKFLANVQMPPPADFFSIKPWKVMQNLEGDAGSRNITYLFTILVKSAAGFARRRFHIRRTWGSMAEIEGKKIAVMFVIGLPLLKPQQTLLEEENQLYGDILQGDVLDSYKSLPSKVLAGYQFVAEYMGNASEFFISTDDDCFVSVSNAFDYFSHLDPAKRNAAHCGYVFSSKSSRITNPRSKWFVPYDVYPMNPYPKFCHGGMTVLSYEMLRDIYRVSLVTNYTGFHLEDVLTNGILREKLQKGNNSISTINMRDKVMNRRFPMMWHLGYKKDAEMAFNGIWSGVKRRFTHYVGPFDRPRGFRVVLKPIVTLKNRSLPDTIDYFSPVTMPPKASVLKEKDDKNIPPV